MSLKTYIPFTAARQRYKIQKNLQKYYKRFAKQADALGEVEYPDGKVVYVPIEWDGEMDRWKTPNGKHFFPRGKGGGPKMLAGQIPLVRLFSTEAAPISTEAAIIAGAEETDNTVPVDEAGNELEAEEGEADPWQPVEGNDGPGVGSDPDPVPATDGGAVPGALSGGGPGPTPNAAVEQVEEADRKVDYPVDGIEFELSDAAEYDPNPVTQETVQAAVDHARRAGSNQAKLLKMIGYGAAAGVGIVLLVLGFVWLLNQIGGGSEGGGGAVISMAKPLAALAWGVFL